MKHNPFECKFSPPGCSECDPNLPIPLASHPFGCGCDRCVGWKFQVPTKLDAVRKAIAGESGADAERLATIGIDIVDTLLRKNHDYGCSAWRPPVLAPGMTPRQAIQCRMSDKISRLHTLLSGEVTAQVEESIEDTVKDLSGYGILWLGADPEK